jgi:enoyl reductase-like protein
MGIIVEDGTGLANANSYIDSTYADTYFADRGITGWASLTNKDALLIQATDYIETVYYGKWKGERLTTTQALEFPRVIDSVDVGVPDRLKKACAELAWKANSGTLLVDVEQRIIKEKVAVIETTYSEYDDQLTQYSTVYNLLSEYLENASLNSSTVTRT